MTITTIINDRYEHIERDDGQCVILRNDRPWRDVTGDDLMAMIIEELGAAQAGADRSEGATDKAAHLGKQVTELRERLTAAEEHARMWSGRAAHYRKECITAQREAEAATKDLAVLRVANHQIREQNEKREHQSKSWGESAAAYHEEAIAERKRSAALESKLEAYNAERVQMARKLRRLEERERKQPATDNRNDRQAKLLREETKRADGLRAKLKDTERLLESARKENDRLRDVINEHLRF